jgi:hypothetical protein
MSEDEKDTEQPQQPGWEKRELAINAKMKDMLKLGITSTTAEIEVLRKKLKRLQYGR